MRFTHHARNKMRQRSISPTDIGTALANPLETRQDDRGNPVITGAVEARSLVVVLASDDPRLVITVYWRRA